MKRIILFSILFAGAFVGAPLIGNLLWQSGAIKSVATATLYPTCILVGLLLGHMKRKEAWKIMLGMILTLVIAAGVFALFNKMILWVLYMTAKSLVIGLGLIVVASFIPRLYQKLSRKNRIRITSLLALIVVITGLFFQTTIGVKFSFEITPEQEEYTAEELLETQLIFTVKNYTPFFKKIDKPGVIIAGSRLREGEFDLLMPFSTQTQVITFDEQPSYVAPFIKTREGAHEIIIYWLYGHDFLQQDITMIRPKKIHTEEESTSSQEIVFEDFTIKLKLADYLHSATIDEIEEDKIYTIEIETVDGEGLMKIQEMSTSFPDVNTYSPFGADNEKITYFDGARAFHFYTESAANYPGVYMPGAPLTVYIMELEDKWIQFDYYGDETVAEYFEKVLGTLKFK